MSEVLGQMSCAENGCRFGVGKLLAKKVSGIFGTAIVIEALRAKAG